MSRLTQEEKNCRLAAARGWTEIAQRSTPTGRIIWTGLVPDAAEFESQGALETAFPLPDYFGDLNVIVAAIAALPPTWNSSGFEQILAEILNLGDAATDWKDDWTSHIKFAQASAAERAEALGLDLGLWKEGE